MTREEFERLPFDEQIGRFLESDLWGYTVCNDYEIVHTDELDEYIEDGVVANLRDSGFADLSRSLNHLCNRIDGYTGQVYRDFYNDWWDDFRPLTERDLSDILDEYSDDEYYAEFFEAEPPEEEGLSFEGIEELIA